VGPNDYLENLELALMVAGEARKGEWAILADVIYLDFDRQSAAVRAGIDTGSQAALRGALVQVAASRALGPSIEILGGVRYFAVEAALDFSARRARGRIGAVGQRLAEGGARRRDRRRARARAHRRARLVRSLLSRRGYRVVVAHLAGPRGRRYSFKWGDVLLTYRHLYYDQKGDKLLQKMEFSGPALGARFAF
jgi:hypothetical protein